MYRWYCLTRTLLQDESDRHEVYSLLRDHYVENAGGEFRIFYSESFLEWDMGGQGTDQVLPGAEEWQVGIRNQGRLVGFLSGILTKMKIWDEPVCDCAEINFFCIHADFRKRRHDGSALARIMINEVTRRVYQTGVRLALFTGGQELPDVVSRVRYYHRKVNVTLTLGP